MTQLPTCNHKLNGGWPTPKILRVKNIISNVCKSCLKSVLGLQAFYRDSIRSVRESLGASNALSHFNSMSSLGQPPSQGARSKMSGAGGTQSSRGKSKSGRTGGSVMSSDQGEEHGVSLADEETMLWHLDAFCARIRQILDVINTLTQFTKCVATGFP